ncbi:MAG: alpha/beta hydrolase [Comamonadaceae bacterium]|nr:MAG: alpha/beta hydrolase [Comamonadaceae bacterium]
MYKESRPSRSEFVPIRNLQYHVRIWQGAPENAELPPLVLVHGWMDVAASWQFMVDALSEAFFQGRTVIAPDWRGFGFSRNDSTARPDSYWFVDYLADLDFLLDHYAPGRQIDLVGHSMGGNVSMLYSGVRPERIRKLANLEGFGMPASKPSQAPGRYAKWMDDLKKLHRDEIVLKNYESVDGVAGRLMKTNPRLSADKAAWLAAHWSRQEADGRWHVLGDPAHKITSAQIYRLDEVSEILKRITAPTLAVEASDDSLQAWFKGAYTLAEYHERLKNLQNVEIAVVQDAGHMLHHDQPQQLASLLEAFLERS